MTQSLKNFIEGYKAVSSGERRFVDKHVVIKHEDRNGNGDEVFKASKVKTVKRAPDHGYDVGADEAVYEDHNLDEKIRWDDDDSYEDRRKKKERDLKRSTQRKTKQREFEESYSIKSLCHEKTALVKNGKVVKTFTGASAPADAKLHLSKIVKESFSEDNWKKDHEAVINSRDSKFIHKMINKWGERGNVWLKHANSLKEEVELDEAKSLANRISHVGKSVFDKSNGRTGSVWGSYSDGSHDIKWKGDKSPTRHDWTYTKNNIRIATKKDEHKKYIKEDLESLDESFGSKMKSFSDFKNMAQDWADNHTHHGEVDFTSKHIKTDGGRNWHQTTSSGEDRHGNRFIIGVFNHKRGKSSDEGHGWHHHWSQGLDESVKDISYNKKNLTKEDIEQIDELSNKTLGNYVTKSIKNKESSDRLANKYGPSTKAGVKFALKSDKRSSGLRLAGKRIASKVTKEDIISNVLKTYLDEDFTPRTDVEKLQDNLTSMSESYVELLTHMFESLDSDNQKYMLSLSEDTKLHSKLVDFALQHKDEFSDI